MTARKIVVVTGCSSGFGKLLTESLLERGHRVFAGVRSQKDLRAELGPDAIALDVTSDASVAAAFAAIREKTDRIDVLVNNAGVSAMGVAEGFTPAQLSSLLDVNLLGAHRLCRAALPLMRAAGSGLLVFVSTGLARMPMPCFGPYAASKAAVEALAEAFRYELMPSGIETVIVEPGPYPTSLGSNALAPDDADRVAAYGPLAVLPAKMMEGLSAWFSSPGSPDAKEVPEAITKLIEAPRGTRPLRLVVGGTGSALTELNALTDRLQAQALASQGLDALLKLESWPESGSV
ncbi:MAG: SDR family oxidoreductase [Myxococcales bacterium]|nr:SDR family oxidoreductase [Myxococcales bacterium]